MKSFATHDEWYFNMRWVPDGKAAARLTPILVAKPSDQVRKGPYVYPQGPYAHIIADSGRTETMMWLFERTNGGRSFGFTGGHTHANWGMRTNAGSSRTPCFGLRRPRCPPAESPTP